jgi:hypothetical protein
VVSKTLMRFSAAGAQIHLEPGEQAVEVPADELPPVPPYTRLQGLGPVRRYWFEAGLEVASFGLSLLGALGVRDAVWRWWRRGATAWLVRDAQSGLRLQIARPGPYGQNHARAAIVGPPARVELVRAWEESASDDGLLALHCRLALVWDDTQLPVSPALKMPRTTEARDPFLEKLVRLRAIGQQMADLLRMPYHERFVRNPT